MSTPPPRSGLPRFFLDRSIGRLIVPRGLRAADVDLVTLAERYGIPEDERIADVQWMRDAAAHGEAVLMCDDAIRRKNPEEQHVLVEVRLRAFVVSSRLSGAEVVRVNQPRAHHRISASPRAGPPRPGQRGTPAGRPRRRRERRVPHRDERRRSVLSGPSSPGAARCPSPTSHNTTTRRSRRSGAPRFRRIGELAWVDPRVLVVRVNVRADAALDRHFVRDIADRGVREPIPVRRREDGALVVRKGHRRALAAVEAGVARVRVFIEPGPPGYLQARLRALRAVAADAHSTHRRVSWA
ncbi:MAG: hypothetical protein ACT4RN_06300 [Pseudonocardia sp.]